RLAELLSLRGLGQGGGTKGARSRTGRAARIAGRGVSRGDRGGIECPAAGNCVGLRSGLRPLSAWMAARGVISLGQRPRRQGRMVLDRQATEGEGAGAMLKSIKLNGVGPVRGLSAQFSPRLNVLTGDN